MGFTNDTSMNTLSCFFHRVPHPRTSACLQWDSEIFCFCALSLRTFCSGVADDSYRHLLRLTRCGWSTKQISKHMPKMLSCGERKSSKVTFELYTDYLSKTGIHSPVKKCSGTPQPFCDLLFNTGFSTESNKCATMFWLKLTSGVCFYWYTLTKVLVGIADIKIHGQLATPSSHCVKRKPLNGRKQLTFHTLSE